MKYHNLSPIKQSHTNIILKAPEGQEDIVEPLPCTRIQLEDDTIVYHSVWYEPSFLKRLSFLLTGKISFLSHSDYHPPVSIGLNEFVKHEDE